MSGHIAWGALTLVLLIFAIDWAVSTLAKRRREREMRKYGMLPGAFKGTKANNWWEA